ncbi:uncharacterized protein N7473_001689 [Penicillium subrubescens]|uniref:uncharacterized protein n=1 Tax=Penicillium subrubescens TaxID=1316194 RepID=UPI00254550FD|nr:uncharacterized protein N7473_001689 [Penicillium subrubescens]KAJ5904773.1 hypothetical protein N7473_001689 [Penicillium subrubescens]
MSQGCGWRSSRWLIATSITIALFSETFLYGFIVPILPYMIEKRLSLDQSRTQPLSAALLAVHGFFALISAPIIAHFADKSPNRKVPLLIALAGCFTGTLLIALTHSLWALFLGRILQGITGSASWVVGFALLMESVAAKDLGATMGVAMSFVTAGVISGPMISGVLLQLLGYWLTWSVPLTVLIIDVIARLIMLEPRDLKPSSSSSSASSTESRHYIDPDETTNLLSSDQLPRKNSSSRGFYRIMLQEPRVIPGFANALWYSLLMATFNSSLPVHLRLVFGWGSLPTGMVFFCLQIPTILLAGVFGWLRDRFGLKVPTTVGWLCSAPLLWFLGIPGNNSFPWASSDTNGKPIFIGCVIAFGVVSMLVHGAGFIQLTYVVRDKQAQDPYIFGPHGGSSRVFSMIDVACSLGMMVGPLVSSLLLETVGFYYMNIVFAMTCLAMAGISFIWFDGKPIPLASHLSFESEN